MNSTAPMSLDAFLLAALSTEREAKEVLAKLNEKGVHTLQQIPPQEEFRQHACFSDRFGIRLAAMGLINSARQRMANGGSAQLPPEPPPTRRQIAMRARAGRPL